MNPKTLLKKFLRIMCAVFFLWTVTLTGSLAAQDRAVERFDASGMPGQPTSFVEQQIWDLIQHHASGDINNAIFIQRKLGQYYQEKGDLGRAQAAFRLAAAAKQRGNAPSAPAASVEKFDMSGMPPQPTNFEEQQIVDLVNRHRSGDIADAIFIQNKLARYYKEKGDAVRAQTASQLAVSAQQTNHANTDTSSPSSPDSGDAPNRGPAGDDHVAAAANQPPRGAFDGSYYRMVNGTLEKWDFSRNGGFTHTGVAAAGAGSSRNFERGTYEIDGRTLILHVGNTANTYSTDRATGAAQSSASATRRTTIRMLGAHGANGLVIGGARFTPRHGW